jgi:hypothetical protein
MLQQVFIKKWIAIASENFKEMQEYVEQQISEYVV